MATTDQYLIFYIYSSDLAFIQSVQGSLVTPSPGIVGNGIGAILAAPDDAAIKYAAPKLPAHSAVVAPGIGSTWFGTEDHFPTNVATFDRKSGGWFGWSWLFGDTTHYHWRGIFVYVPPAVPVGGLQPTSVRRWIDGFEVPGGGEGGNGALQYSRDASRHTEGLGLALRATSSVRSHSLAENGAVVTPAKSWERFYFRIRQYPAAPTTFWRAKTSISPASGFCLQVTPLGQITVNTVDSIGTVGFQAASVAYPVDVWHRLDMFVNIDTHTSGFGTGSIELWVDGFVVLNVGGMDTGGGALNVQQTSEMGCTVANTLGMDIDDWINCIQPGTPDGIDFQNGSGIFLISPTAIDAATAGWTGDYRGLASIVPTNALATVVSAVVSAPLVVTTDWHQVILENSDACGMMALRVMSAVATETAGALLGVAAGSDLPGIPAPAAPNVGPLTSSVFWSLPSQVNAFKPAAAIKLQKNHGTAAGSTTVRSLLAAVELIGIFASEDAPHVTPAPKGLPARLPIHNSPYPGTPWARLTTTPIQPILLVTGTYVGNGVGQDLLFPVPIHFFRTRPLTAEAGGAIWFSSMQGPHTAIEQQMECGHMPKARIDPNFVPAGQDTQQQQTILSIAGAHTQSNAAGVTYAYVAIGDPGMRFCVNACVRHEYGTVDEITNLIHPRFTPLAGFFVYEGPNASTTAGMFYKGPGNLPASYAPLGSGGEVANAVTFGLASVTNKSAFNTVAQSDQVAMALFRTDDTSGNAGKVIQVFSYTGDGNASRTLACSPVSGKRPMWAIIIPHNSNAIYRDPSHLTTHSSTYNTGGDNPASGISGGGIDQISIGITLNTLGVIYDVFCIPGDTVAGNGGWSAAGMFMPVSPEPPPDAPFDPTSPQEPPNGPVGDPTAPPSPIPDPLPPVGPMPSLTDDLAAACILETTRMVNIALTRIGVNTQIAVVATDATPEATAVRLLYNDAIQETLRDFAWPFATRYVQLAVLNGGIRPNSDWLYAYRQPSDCIFERRIVISRTDVANAAPIPFALSSDYSPGDALAIPAVPASGGNVIFCNTPNAILEYTARPKCPHTAGEPLFREAAAWKLAELMAPSLSRLTETAVNCAKGYAETIGKAQLVMRPGNAGELPATSTLDTTAAQLAANLQVINLALVRIGARTIRSISIDQSREAQVARIVFEQELRATLRDFPWSFATQYAALALVGGTTSVPVNADWQYSYRLPTDVVFVRRLVDSSKRAYERQPEEFRTAKDATGSLLYTDAAIQTTVPVTIEYTNRPAGAVSIADDLFRDAFAWRMAWTMAPSLAQIVPERPEAFGRGPEDGQTPKSSPAGDKQLRARAADTARQCYYFALATAKAAAANEGQADLTNPDSDWISGRD